MKSLLKVSLAALTLAFAVSSHAADKKLVVATDTAFVPFEFKQGDKYVGFDVDLWDAIAKELKLDYTLKPMDFSGIIPALQTKNIDLALAGITITDERKKAIDFSDGYYKSGLLVMVKANNNDIKSVKDLDGKVVAVKSGTGSVDYTKANIKTKDLRQFPNIDNAYMELRDQPRRRCSARYAEHPVLYQNRRQRPVQGGRRIAGSTAIRSCLPERQR